MTTIAHDEPRWVTGGVDTHKDVHVAAVLDAIGRLMATASFRPPATVTGDCCGGCSPTCSAVDEETRGDLN